MFGALNEHIKQPVIHCDARLSNEEVQNWDTNHLPNDLKALKPSKKGD